MNFPIEIRHMATGLAKVFHSIEDLAEHLRDNVKEEWEGWTHLRLHPALAALDEPVAAAPAPSEPSAPEAPAAPPAGAPVASGLMETAAVPEHWDAQGEPLPGNPLLADAPAQPEATAALADPTAASTSEAPSETHAEEPAAAPQLVAGIDVQDGATAVVVSSVAADGTVLSESAQHLVPDGGDVVAAVQQAGEEAAAVGHDPAQDTTGS